MKNKKKTLENFKQIGIILLVVVLKIMKNFLHGQDPFPELNSNTNLYLATTNSPYMSEYPQA